MISYTVIRSRRKTFAIQITKDASVEVRVPVRSSAAEIDRVVAANEKWIISHLAKALDRITEKSVFSLNYGDAVILRGKSFLILPADTVCAFFDGERFNLPPGLSSEDIRQAVIGIYRTAAGTYLTERTAELSAITGVCLSAVKISNAKTRWGSCSGRNSLNFSWRLIIADDALIDYVVIHELAHIREHNHSVKFWAIVESALPDYRERKRRLSTLHKRLASQNWD